jgi:hypothetical protein
MLDEHPQLSAAARGVMASLAERFPGIGPGDPWHEIEPRALGDSRDELVAAGMIRPKEGSAWAFRLTPAGRSWLLDYLHLVVAYCPKCSSAVELPRGSPGAQARCATCFVTWTEDTTATPFVPKY